MKTLFILYKSKTNVSGKSAIKCRITYKRKRKQFSTGIFVYPIDWNNKSQKLKPPNEESNLINSQLSLIKSLINQAFLFLQVNKENFDVEDVYLKYVGKDAKEEKTVLSLFNEHNDRVEKLIGKEYVLPTLWKFRQSRSLLKAFVKYQYNKNDYLFKDLDINFIRHYEFYLTINKNLAQSSTYKVIQRFRKIIKIAIAEGYLDKDPFLMYKVKKPKPKVVFLSPEELKNLESKVLKQKRLQQVKDMFVFCCYTGLAFNEMDRLTKKDIITGFDGNLWIQMYREKTQGLLSIPLLPKAIEIAHEYEKTNDRVFPKISNQKFNSYLKEIADIVGIEKKLTHHIARKTFATTVLLYNDVSMEVVSELLGHSSITITQEHYAKVVQKKVGEEMNKLSSRIGKKKGSA